MPDTVIPVPQAALDRISMRVPPFWADDPALWFAQLESQFVMAGIVRDHVKFHTVTGALEQRFAVVVRDVILNPPDEGKYDRIKDELIKRLSPSQESRFKRLLQHEEIGDRTPSQFLRHLRGLGGTAVRDELLRTLWLGRLPLRMQDILAASATTDLEALALLADRISENTPAPSHIASVGPPPETSIQGQLDAMSKQIAALSTNPLRSSTTNRQRTSPGRDSSNEDMCWYHRTFGEHAKQCRKPCNYKAKNAMGRQ